jgi:hypothetical protein
MYGHTQTVRILTQRGADSSILSGLFFWQLFKQNL